MTYSSCQRPAQSSQALALDVVPRGQRTVVGAALEAGADRCLLLPIEANVVAGAVAPVRAGDLESRNTLRRERVPDEDRWQDDGGQGVPVSPRRHCLFDNRRVAVATHVDRCCAIEARELACP
jgi:hypothetical protein